MSDVTLLSDARTRYALNHFMSRRTSPLADAPILRGQEEAPARAADPAPTTSTRKPRTARGAEKP